MKLDIQVASTSQTVNVFVRDSSSTTGAGLTGLAYNTASLTAYYALPRAAAVSISLATLAAVTSSYSSGGFKEIDSTNMPGWYRFDIPDGALASGRFVSIHLQGATNMAPLPLEIELTGWDNQDAVRGGLTALPNAAAAASGGLPTVDSVNSVKIQTPLKKNTGRDDYEFVMQDSSGNAVIAATVVAQRSIDGGAFASCANAPTEVSNGVYKIDLAAADLNGNTIMLRFSATAAKDTLHELFPLP